ncbi:hypothetical protein [Marinilactibacillus sp. Marseille-P9653]|uniref:hypothetical protein n=1 Tax=Marinilactibacillus sp. Marseille-P9653 TaxID=2866583 RepID=UPI001CE3ED4C|nr:hypothetical protein [Marinilactibacillus sp. Marseille-P9653]
MEKEREVLLLVLEDQINKYGEEKDILLFYRKDNHTYIDHFIDNVRFYEEDDLMNKFFNDNVGSMWSTLRALYIKLKVDH